MKEALCELQLLDVRIKIRGFIYVGILHRRWVHFLFTLIRNVHIVYIEIVLNTHDIKGKKLYIHVWNERMTESYRLDVCKGNRVVSNLYFEM
jgi:hypothetical protein